MQLAARLRQSVQGCALHLHGPVQAWQAIEEAAQAGTLHAAEVAGLAIEACQRRLRALASEAVPSDDPRIRKEQITQRFIAALFGQHRPPDDSREAETAAVAGALAPPPAPGAATAAGDAVSQGELDAVRYGP